MVLLYTDNEPGMDAIHHGPSHYRRGPSRRRSIRETGPDETTCVPDKRFRRTRDMPELRCCLFELVRLNLIESGLPRPEPITGKNRFFAAECDFSLVRGAEGRGAAATIAEVWRDETG